MKNAISERVKILVKQISGKITEEDGELLPEYTIKSDKKELWCYSVSDKTMVKVYTRSPVYILQENYDERDRTLIYTYHSQIVLIEKEKLQLIGYD
jgi:hypothetical protein